MDIKKKSFNRRAFVTIMTGLTGLGLPISGLLLHAYSHRQNMVGRHLWFTFHVFFGVLFIIFVVWHIVLNRRQLLNYFKSSAAKSLPFSREARWAVIITIAFLIMMIIHAL